MGTLQPGELALSMTRVLPAPPPVVFKALTEPDELAKWWGPSGFTAPSVEVELHVGGSYRIAMQPPDGDLFYLSGEFVKVDPPAHLSYTFWWEDPDPDDQETVVTLSLRDLGESTELVFTQRTFATKARHALHEQGWTDGLDRLHELMSSQAAMSQENVDVVRRFIEALPRAQVSDDWQPVLAEVDPDVEIEDLDITLDTGHFRGHDSVRKWIGVWMESWESWSLEDVQVRPVGEDRAIGLFLVRAKGKGSGIELSRRDAMVCTLRSGKIEELTYYNDQRQALEAAGLPA